MAGATARTDWEKQELVVMGVRLVRNIAMADWNTAIQRAQAEQDVNNEDSARRWQIYAEAMSDLLFETFSLVKEIQTTGNTPKLKEGAI